MGLVLSLVSQATGLAVLNSFGSLVSLGAFVTFLLFMNRLAAFIGEDAMAKGAMVTLSIGGLTLGLFFAGALAAGLASMAPRSPLILYGPMMMLAGLFCGLVLLIRDGNLITGLRKAVIKYVETDRLNRLAILSGLSMFLAVDGPGALVEGEFHAPGYALEILLPFLVGVVRLLTLYVLYGNLVLVLRRALVRILDSGRWRWDLSG